MHCFAKAARVSRPSACSNHALSAEIITIRMRQKDPLIQKAYNKLKAEQLGVDPGTAAGKLRKSLLFSLIKELERNYCFQCGALIENENELSIEHKIPWLHSDEPQKLFFDLTNIAYSHLSCNIKASRKKPALNDGHGTYGYGKGCRCNDCVEAKSEYRKKWASSTI